MKNKELENQNSSWLHGYRLYFESTGTFSIILMDVIRDLTKDMDFISFVKGRELKHFIGENVLDTFKKKIIELWSNNENFTNYQREYSNLEMEFPLACKNLRENIKDLKILLEFFKKVSNLLNYYFIIDFDLDKEDEIKLKKNSEIYNNYLKTGILKNKKREFLNNFVLHGHSEFYNILKEIGREFKINKDIFFYTKNDLIKLYSGIKLSKEEIKLRKKAYAIVTYNQKLYYYFGNKAIELYNKVFEISSKRLSMILKGQSVFYNNKKIKGIVKRFDLDTDNIKSDILKLDNEFSKKRERIILVTKVTLPEMTNILKKFSAIVTDYGGLNSHAAIISREYKIPCIVGTYKATKLLKNGDVIELDFEKNTVTKIS